MSDWRTLRYAPRRDSSTEGVGHCFVSVFGSSRGTLGKCHSGTDESEDAEYGVGTRKSDAAVEVDAVMSCVGSDRAAIAAFSAEAGFVGSRGRSGIRGVCCIFVVQSSD